jgi:8-amino-3,8-dideoxy-alpha-D-manno-octulosonate transaminase
MNESWPTEFPGVNWLGSEEEAAVVDVVRSRSLFRFYGPNRPHHVADFERQARDYYGVAHALAVNSGTGALVTAMSALGVGPGTEVIVPAFLWVATTAAAVQCNAIPVLCDIDDSFNLDPGDLEERITPRTKLIVPVHMSGAPCDMDAIIRVAEERGVPVLEDCAQCNGGSFRGRKVGTFGAAGMFSLQLNKNMTTGDGGLLLTDDPALFEKLMAVHDLGIPWRGQSADDTGFTTWGQGRRMSELTGAVANVQLGRLAQIVDHMRGSKQRVRAALEDIEGLSLRRLLDPEGDTGAFLIVSLPEAERAQRMVDALGEVPFGLACRIADFGMHVYSNIPSLVRKVPLSPAGNPWSLAENRESRYDYGRGACPRADDLFDRSVIMSVPSRLSREQEDEMVRIIGDAARSALS